MGYDAPIVSERDSQLRQWPAGIPIPERRVPASDRDVESPSVDVGSEVEAGQYPPERRQRRGGIHAGAARYCRPIASVFRDSAQFSTTWIATCDAA